MHVLITSLKNYHIFHVTLVFCIWRTILRNHYYNLWHTILISVTYICDKPLLYCYKLSSYLCPIYNTSSTPILTTTLSDTCITDYLPICDIAVIQYIWHISDPFSNTSIMIIKYVIHQLLDSYKHYASPLVTKISGAWIQYDVP